MTTNNFEIPAGYKDTIKQEQVGQVFSTVTTIEPVADAKPYSDEILTAVGLSGDCLVLSNGEMLQCKELFLDGRCLESLIATFYEPESGWKK
jgi:hypothetical protein